MIKVLILCTGNSARSILGEALFNALGEGRITAYSAGSQPAGAVNPMALETLARHGINASGARSKSWNEFSRNAVPPPPSARDTVSGSTKDITFDFVFTVCGNAANEICPVWHGHPAKIHWGIDDPAHVDSGVADSVARREAFEVAYQGLRQRVTSFLALPLETQSIEKSALAARRIHAETISAKAS